MNIIKPLMWRKGVILSATFLFTIFLGTSCKKKVNTIGQNSIDQSQILSSDGVDTFSFNTYTIYDDIDSLVTDGALNGVIGSYVDPVFGPVNAEVYTQLKLKAFNPNFGDISLISIDSVVLGLEYDGFYGNIGDQNFEVYEIDDADGMNIDSTYYGSSVLSANGANLVAAGMGTINLNPSNLTVIGNDTVDSQARIHLDTSFGWNFINEANSNISTFTSHELFNEFFKGLQIKVNNGLQNTGEGGLFYFDLNESDTKMTIYYTQDGFERAYDIVITGDCAKFNHVDIDHSMTDVADVEATPSEGQDQFYAQAFGSRAMIEIPGLDNIPANAVIHKATLTVPVEYETGNKFYPSGDITATTLLDGGGYGFYDFVAFEEFNKQYTIDLRAYAQAVVNKQVENTGMALAPVLYITSGDRIIFNGPTTTNKNKPRLNIVYTEF